MPNESSARGFAWDNMFVRPEEDPRREAAFVGERAALVGFLRDQRLTLEMKCAGLTSEQLARRSAEPSKLSLLGLVRHMAEVERMWFRHASSRAPLTWTSDLLRERIDGRTGQ